MKREHPPESGHTPAGGGKAKMKWEAEKEGEVDELLAVLGYKVKSSEMAQVAHKLEQLEQVMMCGVDDDDDDGLLSQHKVHYNPSDLSTWLESMLSDFNPSSNFSISSHPTPSSEDKNCLGVDPFSDSDLQSIPGKAILNPPSSSLYHPTTTTSSNNNTNSSGSSCVTTSRVPKRVRYDNTSSSQISPSSSRPVVVLDSQETGIRLVHTLMACAEAIQQDNLALAEALVKQIGFLANSQVGSMKKVATYFAQALARRLYQIGNNKYEETNTLSEMLEMHFYEACPYLKFAHFTANQAILEAFAGKKKVHVIDFSMKQGMQWPALMQALALRSEGPPIFRLTGIGPPAPDNSDRLQEVGWKLAQFADSIRIQFEYRGFVVNSLTDLEAGLLDLRPDSEVVAVNSVFEMRKLLNKPGSVEKVLRMIKEVNPVLLTCVEQEASHNGSVFADRFNESLHYYSTMFDSLERCVDNEDKVMTEVYLGKQICNIVACEGVDRVERHETIAQWRIRFGSVGFVPVHLGSNAFKQASMLLDFFAGGEGYGVEENDGCLMLGWHSRPLITTSAWRLAYNSVPTRC